MQHGSDAGADRHSKRRHTADSTTSFLTFAGAHHHGVHSSLQGSHLSVLMGCSGAPNADPKSQA